MVGGEGIFVGLGGNMGAMVKLDDDWIFVVFV
jgi:hypothetical protein